METTRSDESEVVQYPCASCGTQNRIPRRRLRDDPKCGKCHQKVFPRKPVPVGGDRFRSEVEDCPIPVLVDFWAPWCGPCHAVAPVLDQLARERGGRLKIAKLNIDENPQLAARFGVRSIPTMILLRGPIHVDQVTGALGKEALGRTRRATRSWIGLNSNKEVRREMPSRCVRYRPWVSLR